MERDKRFDAVFSYLVNSKRDDIVDVLEIVLGIAGVLIGGTLLGGYMVLRNRLDRRARQVVRSEVSLRIALMYNDIAIGMLELSKALRQPQAGSTPGSQSEHDRQADVHLDAAIQLLRNAFQFELPRIAKHHPDREKVVLMLKNTLAYLLVNRPTIRDSHKVEALNLSREVYEHRNDADERMHRENRFDTFVFVRVQVRRELEPTRAALAEWQSSVSADRQTTFNAYEQKVVQGW